MSGETLEIKASTIDVESLHRCETLFLAVGGFGTVLAEVVVLADVGGNGIGGSIEEDGAKRKAGDVFKHIGVLHGIHGAFAPGKGSVPCHQHAGNGDGVECGRAESANDDSAGVADVAAGDLFGGERLCDRDRSVEIIGVGGAEARDGTSGLCPGGGELRVGVDDATYLREFAIERVWVSRSLDGRREPSTILPSRSVTTRSSGFREA